MVRRNRRNVGDLICLSDSGGRFGKTIRRMARRGIAYYLKRLGFERIVGARMDYWDFAIGNVGFVFRWLSGMEKTRGLKNAFWV